MLKTIIFITQRKPSKEWHSTDWSVITSDKAEELIHDIAVNTESDWNTEVSRLKKKIHNIEEEKMVLQNSWSSFIAFN